MKAGKYAVFAAVLLVISGMSLFIRGMTIADSKIVKSDGSVRQVILPYVGSTVDDENIKLSLQIRKNWQNNDWLNIIRSYQNSCSVSSISVNGKNIDLNNLAFNPQKISESGAVLPLGRYFTNGINQVEINLKTGKGWMVITGLPAERDAPDIIFHAVFILSILILMILILKLYKRDDALIVIITAGILLRILYLNFTMWYSMTNDIYAHIQYIEYIFRNLRLPDKSEGFAFYHPPLYYLISTLIYCLISLLSGGNISLVYRGLQAETLVLNIVFTLTAIKILDLSIGNLKETYRFNDESKISRMLNRKNLLILGSAFIVFWPINVIHSASIGNDGLLYPLFALALYFLCRWDTGRSAKHIYLSAIFTFLSIITKTSGVIMMGITAAVFALVYFNPENKEKRAGLLKSGLIIALIFIIGIAAAFRSNFSHGFNTHVLVGNVQWIDPVIYVNNEAYNYLYFDVKTFISEPFAKSWVDSSGRQYFWNYLGKTSLFGEFVFTNPLAGNIAEIISFLFLFLCIISIIGTFSAADKGKAGIRVLIITFICLVFSSMAFRISLPTSCSGAFRYIQPALIPMIFFYLLSLKVFERKGWLRLAAVSEASGALFVILSSVFSAVLIIFQVVIDR